MARGKRNTSGNGSFAWPGRKRSAELELAANRAAEQGLKRLRDRRPVGGPVPPPLTVPAPRPPNGNGGASHPGVVDEQEPRPAAAPPAKAPGAETPTPDIWESDYNSLADELAAELRRDLGPSRG